MTKYTNCHQCDEDLTWRDRKAGKHLCGECDWLDGDSYALTDKLRQFGL